jgi:uncharacterized membrane protein
VLTDNNAERPRKEIVMASNVVVLGFKNQFGAEGLLGDLLKWQEEGLIELEDAVIASRGEGAHIEIEQTHRKSRKPIATGGGVGLLAGLLLGGPILGLAAGVAAGSISRGMKDYGLDDDFVTQTSEWVRPNTSALFLLVKEAKAEEVLERLRPTGAIVLNTTLAPEAEERLRRSLAEEEYKTK